MRRGMRHVRCFYRVLYQPTPSDCLGDGSLDTRALSDRPMGNNDGDGRRGYSIRSVSEQSKHVHDEISAAAGNMTFEGSKALCTVCIRARVYLIEKEKQAMGNLSPMIEKAI